VVYLSFARTVCLFFPHKYIYILYSALEKEKSRNKVSIYPWILQQRCIDMLPIVTAPTPLRNKCELTFGYQYMFPEVASGNNECEVTISDGVNEVSSNDPTESDTVTPLGHVEPRKVPAVGFMVTGWAGGVSFSNTLPNIPYEVGMIVEIVNTFLLDSPLVPYDCATHTGFWRILTIRTSRRTKECMIIIQHNSAPSELPAKLSKTTSGTDVGTVCTQISADTEAPVDCNTIVANEKERLVSLLVNADLLTAPPDHETAPIVIKVTSIFFQEFEGLSNPSPEHPVQVRFFCMRILIVI
jgi:tRNA (uracil-5-)-methyltransferase